MGRRLAVILKNYVRSLCSNTFLKYFMSYLIVMLVLICAFSQLMKTQLMNLNTDNNWNKMQERAERLMEQLDDNLQHLTQLNVAIHESIDVIKLQYQKGATSYQLKKELNKYDTSSTLISSIVFWKNGELVSTNIAVKHHDGVFEFYKSVDNFISWDSNLYFNANKSQFVVAANDEAKLLLFLPYDYSKKGENCLFVLDISEIYEDLYGLITTYNPAAVLIDSYGNVIAGVNEELLDFDIDVYRNGNYEQRCSDNLYVYSGKNNGVTLVMLIDTESSVDELSDLFIRFYIILFILGVVACVLIYVCMGMTYYPLLRVVKKYEKSEDINRNYIQKIDSIIAQSEQSVKQMNNKLRDYQYSVQTAMLKSIFFETLEVEWDAGFSFDEFVEFDIGKNLFLIYIQKTEVYSDLLECISKGILEEGAVTVLGVDNENVIFLVKTKKERQKMQAILVDILYQVCETFGSKSVIAWMNSPMDIPFYYQRAKKLSMSWKEKGHVLEYDSYMNDSVEMKYPHELLDELSEAWEIKDITVVRYVIDKLFSLIDAYCEKDEEKYNYFLQCILLEMASIIVSSIIESGIEFKEFSDTYYEIMFYCRSCSYKEEQNKIKKTMGQLLCIYEQKCNKTISLENIKRVVDMYCYDPEFSIQRLADCFDISVSHMSNLFRSVLNCNFSDYLWELRFQRATDLLINSNKTIDEISVAVGYTNIYSFRRKFKQYTGITPSQYRSNH